ncbi:MAG TPA: hypothetical protein GXZ20_03485 [Halanaerobiaceae bacterium]|nr:hypothetical protein [Bacillota bacterium]HHU92188.1 hypothetical protein [Halanaerobiaceae bacterium]HOA41534.1 hypothetical protein [Halanaerobiales bacterium]HPZ63579.1 hypothetical protein [Halanaerobiales bacterium]HQD04895.1 hypothetical protein [Halanaerobiales bacterium]
MKLADIIPLLQLEPLVVIDDLDFEVETACGCDLMSDVLAFSQEKTLLLTGLTNPQVVRTAEMTDIKFIIFVRGKRPQEETIELAREKGINLYLSPKPMFECCGLLYQGGLSSEKIRRI